MCACSGKQLIKTVILSSFPFSIAASIISFGLIIYNEDGVEPKIKKDVDKNSIIIDNFSFMKIAFFLKLFLYCTYILKIIHIEI